MALEPRTAIAGLFLLELLRVLLWSGNDPNVKHCGLDTTARMQQQPGGKCNGSHRCNELAYSKPPYQVCRNHSILIRSPVSHTLAHTAHCCKPPSPRCRAQRLWKVPTRLGGTNWGCHDRDTARATSTVPESHSYTCARMCFLKKYRLGFNKHPQASTSSDVPKEPNLL